MERPSYALTPDPEDSEVSLEHGVKLFILSYRFSQGEPSLQYDLYEALHKIHPDWRIPLEAERIFRKCAVDGALRFLRPSLSDVDHKSTGAIVHPTLMNDRPIDSLKVKDSIRIESKRLFNVLYQSPNEYNVIPRIAERLVDRDFRLLYHNGGRVRENLKPSAQKTPVGDKWLSQVCYFGLLGNPTGTPEFNQIFSSVKSYLLNEEDRPRIIGPLKELVEIYNQHHEVKVDLTQYQAAQLQRLR